MSERSLLPRPVVKPISLMAEAPKNLVEFWLSLPPAKREGLFAKTAPAACLAEVAPRTLRTWIDAGKVASFRIGKSYRIFLPSLKDLLIKRASVWAACGRSPRKKP